MEHCMSWYGKAFLEASIGSVLRKLCAEKVAIEVDPHAKRSQEQRQGGRAQCRPFDYMGAGVLDADLLSSVGVSLVRFS